MSFKIGYRSYNDPDRGWKLLVKCRGESKKEVVVTPSQYESILKNPDVYSVTILAYGCFGETKKGELDEVKR